MNIQKTYIIGNLGKNPELRVTPTGKSVCNFTVAVNEKYGETVATTWYKVVTWDKLAESCNKYLTKGQLVYCEGRVQVEAWKDKVSEEAKASLVLVAKTVQFGPSGSSLAGEEPGELPF